MLYNIDVFQDVGERNNVSLRLVRQLIPLPKLQAEVITLEPWGSVTDTKGNRLQEFDKDKKHVSISNNLCIQSSFNIRGVKLIHI